jgi:hypothetical protein
MEMSGNLLFESFNIYTATPLIFASLLALLFKTGVWKDELILSSFLAIYAVCSTLVLYAHIDLAFMLSDVSAVCIVVYAVFRERKVNV